MKKQSKTKDKEVSKISLFSLFNEIDNHFKELFNINYSEKNDTLSINTNNKDIGISAKFVIKKLDKCYVSNSLISLECDNVIITLSGSGLIVFKTMV